MAAAKMAKMASWWHQNGGGVGGGMA